MRPEAVCPGRQAFLAKDADSLGGSGDIVGNGGRIVDNVLWSGRVADASAMDDDTAAIRALNAKIHADARVSISMLPVADGLTLALKRRN